MGRNDVSSAVKRIDIAFRLTIRTSSVGETSRAPITSSSSRRLMAMTPPWRGESYSVSAVFLT
jgi:hypothetical protein